MSDSLKNIYEGIGSVGYIPGLKSLVAFRFFENESKVKLYHGDSNKLLPEILQNTNEPVTIYVDAHYSGGDTAYGE